MTLRVLLKLYFYLYSCVSGREEADGERTGGASCAPACRYTNAQQRALNAGETDACELPEEETNLSGVAHLKHQQRFPVLWEWLSG